MSAETRTITKKSKVRGPKEGKNRTYFTKNNLRFVSRRIPTLQEMIVERSDQPRFKHECKLHTSWMSSPSQDYNSSQTCINGDEKSAPHGQTSPSTVSFATLYKATSTVKSLLRHQNEHLKTGTAQPNCNLPTPYEKSPYQKYIFEQKRLAEKCLNVEEEQLERLEKENEEAIYKIAEQFCKKVQSWDEDDTTVAEALQSLNVSESDQGNPSEAVAQTTLDQDKLEKVVTQQDLSHLTNPEWISSLFRICFAAPWSDGFSKVLKEQEGTNDICKGLNIPVSELRDQRIKERIEGDRALKREAAKPKVAFGRSVPRAKGLRDYEKELKTQRLQGVDSNKQQDFQMDLVTMQAIWGNQLNSRSTKHYCKHLRELIQEKIKGTADPSLAAVTLPQMKPKILLEAGMLSMDYSEKPSLSSSLSSTSSLNSRPKATTQKKKVKIE